MAFKLPEALVDTLLGKLSSDDAFRAVFEKSPREALASLGFQPARAASDADAGIWQCCKVTTLASKEQIEASKSALRTQLLATQAALSPIDLQSMKKL